jgi:hypothetical protein
MDKPLVYFKRIFQTHLSIPPGDFKKCFAFSIHKSESSRVCR